MRKGGTAVSRLVITVPTRRLGSGTTTGTGAIPRAVRVTRAATRKIANRRAVTTGTRTAAAAAAARQDPERTRIDRADIPTVTATDITTRIAVISLDFENYRELRSESRVSNA